MDFVEALKTWASMPVPKMIVTMFLIITVGGGYGYVKYSDNFSDNSKMIVTQEFLNKCITNTSFDYLGVFNYDYEIPFQVTEVKKACNTSGVICYKSKDYYLNENLTRVGYHMQNLCEIKTFTKGDPEYNMKIIGSCPILIDKKVTGYVVAASVLNLDQQDMTNFLRKTANNIAAK